MKKYAILFLVHILWPILREVLVDLCKILIKTFGAAHKDDLEKRRAQEKAAAATAEEKATVDRRYDERVKNSEEMMEKMSATVSNVVDQALKSAEGKRDTLIAVPELGKASLLIK